METNNKEKFSKYSEKDIFKMISGEDEFGQPKSVCAVKVSDFNIQNETEQVFEELIIEGAVINVMKTPALTMIDLTFPFYMDPEIVALSDLLKNFATQPMSPDENVLSTIVLTISPIGGEDEVYVTGVHGAFCLMPSVIGGKPDSIRFIFQNDYVFAFEIPDAESDGDLE